jgi:hypothetical protein
MKVRVTISRETILPLAVRKPVSFFLNGDPRWDVVLSDDRECSTRVDESRHCLASPIGVKKDCGSLQGEGNGDGGSGI